MQKHLFNLLRDKYLGGRATEDERKLFELYLERLSGEDPKDLTEAEIRAITETVYARIRADIDNEAKVIPFYRRAVFKYAAAAAIIIMLGAGGYFVLNPYNQRTEDVANTTPVQQDVPPGRDVAILTLADGKQILLDEVSNGAVADQGNVKITKLNGLVSYASGGNVDDVVYNTITTPRGGKYQLVLADGTKVWLDAESSLHFPNVFRGNDRTVKLTGQGYFEVAHNAKMPFRVATANMDVKVLGTHFNINSYSNEEMIRTTLLEGSIEVTIVGQSLRVRPGQQVVANNLPGARQGSQLTIDNSPDLDAVMAWKNGFFSFENTGIPEIMKQLARWYDVEVIYQGEPEDRFTGEIDRSLTLLQVLKVLSDTKVRYRIEEGRKLIILP